MKKIFRKIPEIFQGGKMKSPEQTKRNKSGNLKNKPKVSKEFMKEKNCSDL
jgi:hypothetical protein